MTVILVIRLQKECKRKLDSVGDVLIVNMHHQHKASWY